MKPVLFIVGPTCSGKTDLAFYLALKFSAKIINADSLQMYKYMDIGSAKPDLKKFPSVQCYLFDHVLPPQIYTAGQFEKESYALLKNILPSHICLVVGGSGFYLRALEKGCYPISPVKNFYRKALLEELQSKGLSHLYNELKEKDPDYKVHPHDQYRIIRALIFIRSENKKISRVQKKFKARPLPYSVFKIGLTASSFILRKRVELRVKNMIHRGLVREVQNLINKGLGDFAPMQSVGYKEALMYLKGELAKEELAEAIIQRTMKLIKKQKSWFKIDASIRWYDCETDFREIFDDLKLNAHFRNLI